MLNIDNILESLTEKERIILSYLDKRMSLEELIEKTGLEYADISRNLLWLSNKKLINYISKKSNVYVITKLGNIYKKDGLPERRIFNYLKEVGFDSIDNIRDMLGLDEKEVEASIGFLKRNNIINFGIVNGKRVVKLVNEDDKPIKANEDALNNPNNANKDNIELLLKRGLLEKDEKSEIEVELTDLGNEVKEKLSSYNIELIDSLTPEMIINGSWREKKFRRFDIKSIVPKIYGGRKHPLYWVMDQVKEILISMGFRELDGDWVVNTFWNMDSMFIPQNHPARDVQDTFYIEGVSKLPNGLKEKVKQVHENGLDTGSSGYMYEWSEEEARRIVLRSHTTALTFYTFSKGIKIPDKAFTIGRVFRNENPDSMHMPEFHQIEGFVVDNDINIRDMIGYFTEFYSKFGIKDLRFKPTYNPYTQPSLEIYTKYLNRLIEIGNSGMFRPEALRPYDINANVIAWGLALERLASILFKIKDIRELYGSNSSIDFARNYKIQLFG